MLHHAPAINHMGCLAIHRCTFLGKSLASGAHTIGEPWRFTLHTADGHGNARAAGGEAVIVDVAGPAGSAVRAAVVTDCGNGCYAVAFEPNCAGRWLLTPRHAHSLTFWSSHHLAWTVLKTTIICRARDRKWYTQE